MDKLHDWHVIAYKLAVHGRIDCTRIRDVDGHIVIDNDPEKKALANSIDEDAQVMRERLQAQPNEAAQQDTEENNYWFTLPSLIDDKEQEITKWELLPELTPNDAQIKGEKLASLRAELASLKNQSNAPYPVPLTAPSTTDHSTPSWNLKKPQRFQGYARPLYEFLREANSSGKPKPTPHDVLEAFSKANHPEIANVILGTELHYYTAGGTTIKTANLKAIGEAIRKMTR